MQLLYSWVTAANPEHRVRKHAVAKHFTPGTVLVMYDKLEIERSERGVIEVPASLQVPNRNVDVVDHLSGRPQSRLTLS